VKHLDTEVRKKMNNNITFSPAYSHVGVCVSDLERSKSFYKKAFGFAEGYFYQAGSEVNNLVGLSGDTVMASLMLTLENLVIELIYFESPTSAPAQGLRPINQHGLTHLSLTVNDLDAAIAHVESCGAQVLHQTRTEMAAGEDKIELIFCLDPDGTRIELYKPAPSISLR